MKKYLLAVMLIGAYYTHALCNSGNARVRNVGDRQQVYNAVVHATRTAAHIAFFVWWRTQAQRGMTLRSRL